LLLRELFAFLGGEPDIDLASFPVMAEILPGLPGELSPGLYTNLQRLLGHRTRELASFLEARFDRPVPAEWIRSLGPVRRTAKASGFTPSALIDEEPDNLRLKSEAVFLREFDDQFLMGVLESEEQFSSPRLVLARYKGHHIFLCRDRFLATAVAPKVEGLV
jgi:hypothetical protein